MGILHKAPVEEPTDWCMNMVTDAKTNGSPRRTIDFQPINKYCLRETHHTPCPFYIVTNIPSYSYITVLDVFNGYHQVTLDESSIKLTEFGRYQCLRTPHRDILHLGMNIPDDMTISLKMYHENKKLLMTYFFMMMTLPKHSTTYLII